MYIINELGENDGGLGAAEFSYPFGEVGDEPFVGDFDGDGIDTVGVRRGDRWYLRNSLTPGYAEIVVDYGMAGDLLVVGDWDGDGRRTPGVFRSDEARFHLRFSTTTGPADVDFLFGESGWVPVAGRFGP
ncbi:MAG TPA: hypothetical protein ENK55_00730 [Actinobacteria bacterium]|nr:hypothetical protein [Actinomycetota bacterium]